jgi:hypothetical protein
MPSLKQDGQRHQHVQRQRLHTQCSDAVPALACMGTRRGTIPRGWVGAVLTQEAEARNDMHAKRWPL